MQFPSRDCSGERDSTRINSQKAKVKNKTEKEKGKGEREEGKRRRGEEENAVMSLRAGCKIKL
jgi:hypothetical protein